MPAAKTPPPGSPEARRRGCHCSQPANNWGAERPAFGWFITSFCPMHCLDDGGDFVDLPRVEVHRRNAVKVREIADKLDAIVAELEAAEKAKR